jgi:hypothetical protein
MKNQSLLKALLFFIIVLFTTNNCFCQEPSFTWNLANTKPAKLVDIQLYGNLTDGYYIVNKEAPSGTMFAPTVTVEYFNGKQDRLFTQKILLKNIEDFVDVLYLNKKIYVFSALYDKNEKKNTLFASALNSNGNLESPQAITFIVAEKMSVRGLFKVAVSPDQSKLLVLSQPEYVKNENEKITISTYDSKLQKIISTEQTFPYQWTRSVDNNVYINNSGTVFILKRIDVKGEEDNYSVFSFHNNQLKEFKINLGAENKIANFCMAFSAEGDLAIAGYYTQSRGKISVRMGVPLFGSFLQRISDNGETAKISAVNPFEKKKDLVAKSMVFDKSNTILMSEKYIVSSQAPQRDPSQPVNFDNAFARDYSYYGMDIFIDGFDKDGKSIYNTVVDKNNTSKNDNGTWVSYFGNIINGKLYLIFNDDKYRYDGSSKAIHFGSTKIIVYATMDPSTGVVSKTLPVSNTGPVGGKGADMWLHPDAFLRINESQFVFRAENNNIYRMGLVNF